jgi:peptide/nickel transport system substrate-binding protein
LLVWLGAAKRRGRWSNWRGCVAVMVAAAAALAIAGCGGDASGTSGHRSAARSDGIAGTLPAVGKPLRGGTITVGQLAGQTPSDIFPLVDDAGCTTPTLNFIQQQYVPLYAGPDGAEPAVDQSLSAAESPVYSNGDKTVTIRLRPGLRWSDGKPVVAEDVTFYLDLLKAAVAASPVNWCQYSAGELPDNIASWTTHGTRVVVLHLLRAVNPSWFTTDQLQDVGAGIYPLPSADWNVDSSQGEHVTDWATNPADALKIYQYLQAQGSDKAAFVSNPLWKVVDGPFRLKYFNGSSGAYELVPNAAYSLRPKTHASEVSVLTFKAPASMLQALKSHRLQIGSLDPSTQLGAIKKLKRDGVSVFGGPGWGWFGGVINFKDRTDDFDKVIAQPYVRGVIAELVDQAAIIKSVYRGWAVPAYGPAPTTPHSPYVAATATRAAWPYDPAKAVSTLRAHGWHVTPGGQTTCQRAGTAGSECGAGIPTGTPIRFAWANVSSSISPVGAAESRIFANDARRAAGIDVSFVTGSFSFLTAEYNDQNPAATQYVNDWGVNNYGGALTDFYPTQEGLLGTGGALNLGAYSDPTAQKMMRASVASPSAKAIDSELSYLGRAYPVLYMPDQDWIVAVSHSVGGPADAFRAMTQQQYAFQLLYRVKHR